jgi:hypothetical protein
VAFYQAEASMLNRENQMLRQRIRELGSSALFLSVCHVCQVSASVHFLCMLGAEDPNANKAKERHISELTTSGTRPEQSAPPATQGAEAADHHASAGVGSATEPTNKS